jgi:hypothetical protein
MRRHYARNLLPGLAALWAALAFAQERQPDAQIRAVENGLASDKVFFPLAGGLPEIAFARDERGNVVGAAAGPIQATKIQSAK